MISDPQARPHTALARIVKPPCALLSAPRLYDYDATCAQFNWQGNDGALLSMPPPGHRLVMATDAHVMTPRCITSSTADGSGCCASTTVSPAQAWPRRAPRRRH